MTRRKGSRPTSRSGNRSSRGRSGVRGVALLRRLNGSESSEPDAADCGGCEAADSADSAEPRLPLPSGGVLGSCRAETTGPSTGFEVFAPGRQDEFRGTTILNQERQPHFVAPLTLSPL